jgi:hypothetical protein
MLLSPVRLFPLPLLLQCRPLFLGVLSGTSVTSKGDSPLPFTGNVDTREGSGKNHEIVQLWIQIPPPAFPSGVTVVPATWDCGMDPDPWCGTPSLVGPH